MNFWQRKLLAFLHDPPEKALDIPGHEQRRWVYVRQAGFPEPDALQWFNKEADCLAAEADRVKLPSYKSSKLCSRFGGASHPYRHPLGGTSLPVASPPTPEPVAEVVQSLQHYAQNLPADAAGEERDRLNFLLHWRRWAVDAAMTRSDIACLPADTRIPDHTIWHHNGIAAALQGTRNLDTGNLQPALLLFQAGPVQEFIAQARSTRDLWSGSYLLSWLMAHAIRAVTDKAGPDAVIFPFLRGQPLFDLLHRDSIYKRVPYKGKDSVGKSLADRMRLHEKEVMTPNLPNRFLAVVPQAQAVSLGGLAEAAFRAELQRVGAAVWDWLTEKTGCRDEWRQRFDAQLEAFPSIAWVTAPWDPQSPEWAKACEEINRLMAARRNLRDFSTWPESATQAGTRKDSLSGREDVIGGEEWWSSLRNHPEGRISALFKSESESLGAVNLVKRVWHLACLKREPWSLEVEKEVNFKSVEDVADDHGYVAILAIDGDEMGKWMSGGKQPRLRDQLSVEAAQHPDVPGKDQPRKLTPSFHLQFSEALANVALYLVRPVVEHFRGQLIYAGGDDVLCMVPADRALDCAEALRAAFRGQRRLCELVPDTFEVCGTQGGWVRLLQPKAEQPRWPLLVPGPAADVSVGIAIGHKNAPLQGLVRAAQAAEKRAKSNHGRQAFAVSLFKRSGETVKWGAKWEHGALTLYRVFVRLTVGNKLSGRFAYALEALLEPYVSSSKAVSSVADFPREDVFARELTHVLGRQCAGSPAERRSAADEFLSAVGPYGAALVAAKRDPMVDVPGLLRVANFILRGDRE